MSEKFLRTWEISERKLPRNWAQTGVNDFLGRRALAACLLVLNGTLEQVAACAQFNVKHKPYALASGLLNSSPKFSRRAWDGESLYKLANLRSYAPQEEIPLIMPQDVTLRNEFFRLLSPIALHQAWRKQAALFLRDDPDGRNENTVRLNELYQQLFAKSQGA